MQVISIGDRLDDKYLITRKLGSGGFGDVFLADDEAIPHRRVAIKILARPEDGDQSFLLHEMQTLARFQHPHVVAFYHHFNDDLCLYLVMEYCPGGSLHARLATVDYYPEAQVFAWGLELCETLAFVHEKRIVHHDIKPMSILFAAEDTIKVGDFGIANCNAGTTSYMPPEMLLGERVSRTDPGIDIYALGLTLLESLTGRHPFVGLESAEALRARIAHDFIPSSLPRWVQEVLLKATHPTPELRFQTAADFGNAIRGRHVPYLFDGKRIKADALAKEAESAIARRKWKTGERLASQALRLAPDCVAALLAAGRCQLLIRRIDRALEYFTKAQSINPRTPIQKELGWIHLEQDRLPTAISLLTDHLQRNASDYEAYNLLLKCFYLTDRFEAGETLARTLMDAKAPNNCFGNNRFLCRQFNQTFDFDGAEKDTGRQDTNPFIHYNRTVVNETPKAWGPGESTPMKSKLLFQEYRFGTASRSGKRNTLSIYMPDGARQDFEQQIITIGSLSANYVVLNDQSVSRRHCAIVNYSDDVWLYDLGSTTGTMVDGRPLVGRMLLDGVHDVAIGGVDLRVAASSDLLI